MTAWSEMAAPRSPRVGDARVLCPLCGGLIHPVAGRCKHCKQDLTTFRAGRPQAAVQLPALDGSSGNGHAAPVASAPVPLPQILAARAADESQPILPPRPTAREMAAAAPQPSAWRRWPVLVMGVAVLAIVAAVIVLLWPPGATSHAGKLPPPPAPERMETDPLPPPSGNPTAPPATDPWGGPSAPNPPPAQPHAQITPRHTPDPLPDDPDDTDSIDQMGQLGQLGQLGSGLAQGGTATLLQMAEHLCTRLNQCGTTSSSMQMYCSAITGIKASLPHVADCDARTRCLQKIDELSCSTQADDATALMTFMTQFSECMEAMRQC